VLPVGDASRCVGSRQYGDTTLLSDLKSGMAAEVFGSTVYYINSVTTMDLNTMAGTLFHEALHLLGYTEGRIKESVPFKQIMDKCIGPLNLTY